MDSQLPCGTTDGHLEQAGQEGPVPCIPEAAAWHLLNLHAMTGGSSGWAWPVPCGYFGNSNSSCNTG